MKPIFKRIISQVTAVVMAAEFAGQNAQPFIAAHAESDSGGSKVSAVHSTDVNKGEEAAAASEETNATSETASEFEDLTISSDMTLSKKTEVGNLVISSGTLNLNGNILIVHGDVTVNNGSVVLSKGQLICENFTMNNGYLNMTNANDSIIVNKNYAFKGEIGRAHV